jgi:hypothetical protein
MANMTAAPEYVCNQLPKDKDNHEARKRISALFQLTCARCLRTSNGPLALDLTRTMPACVTARFDALCAQLLKFTISASRVEASRSRNSAKSPGVTAC